MLAEQNAEAAKVLPYNLFFNQNACNYSKSHSTGCEAYERCLSVSPEQIALLQDLPNTPVDQLDPNQIGVCAVDPPSGYFVKQGNSSIPLARAFFPLTDGEYSSFPVPEFYGFGANNLTTEYDETFGEVLRCDRDLQSYVYISNVPYGANGSFTVSLWFKALDISGFGFGDLFSHGGDPVLGVKFLYSANSVQILVPFTDTSKPGVVRAIVRDQNDSPDVYSDLIQLDSDGTIGNQTNRMQPNNTQLQDDKWHFVAVTTNADGQPGYSMYLDGNLVGEVNSTSVNQLDPGYSAPGGDVLDINGPIYLCMRGDGADQRYFDGYIAHLMIHNTALKPDQILDLYNTVKGPDQVRMESSFRN